MVTNSNKANIAELPRVDEFRELGLRCIRDLQSLSADDTDDKFANLQAAIDWLCRAQDQTGGNGVSDGYSLRLGRFGWGPAYRETTGYICETFYDLSQFLKKQIYRDRAIAMSEWLLEVQNKDGSISNPRFGDDGIVFDTGQVLFGLIRSYQETNDPRYRSSAIRAGNWLVKNLDDDGAWRKYTHLGYPHTYNTRVAWALVKLGKEFKQDEFTVAAINNLEWAKSQITDNLFDNCAFKPELAPFVHTIAYAIRGFLESGLLLENKEYVTIAENSSREIFQQMHQDGFISGQISTNGKSNYSYCCLTGNCQMAIIGYKLFEISQQEFFRDSAERSLNYVLRTQDIETSNKNIYGAIKGSHPFWGTIWGTRPIGGYTPFFYPNWATKFFIDALIESQKAES